MADIKFSAETIKMLNRKGAAAEYERAARVAEYEREGEPDGCYHFGSSQHQSSDCHDGPNALDYEMLADRLAGGR